MVPFAGGALLAGGEATGCQRRAARTTWDRWHRSSVRTGWQLAEAAEDAAPHGMLRLLNSAR